MRCHSSYVGPESRRRMYCPACLEYEWDILGLLPTACDLPFNASVSLRGRPVECGCGAPVRSLRVLCSEHHLRLAAAALVECGHVPSGAEEVTAALLARLTGVSAVITAVQDIYVWSPPPGTPPWHSNAAQEIDEHRRRILEMHRRHLARLRARALYPSSTERQNTHRRP